MTPRACTTYSAGAASGPSSISRRAASRASSWAIRASSAETAGADTGAATDVLRGPRFPSGAGGRAVSARQGVLGVLTDDHLFTLAELGSELVADFHQDFPTPEEGSRFPRLAIASPADSGVDD